MRYRYHPERHKHVDMGAKEAWRKGREREGGREGQRRGERKGDLEGNGCTQEPGEAGLRDPEWGVGVLPFPEYTLASASAQWPPACDLQSLFPDSKLRLCLLPLFCSVKTATPILLNGCQGNMKNASNLTSCLSWSWWSSTGCRVEGKDSTRSVILPPSDYQMFGDGHSFQPFLETCLSPTIGLNLTSVQQLTRSSLLLTFLNVINLRGS